MIEGNHIGIVGGGQLGRMLTEAAKPLGFEVTVVDPTPNCPASQAGAEQIQAGLKDLQAVKDLAGVSDVITWEIEHIDVDTLRAAQESGTLVEPDPETLGTIQDKLTQKQFLSRRGIPVAPFMALDKKAHLHSAQTELGDIIIKTRFGGYDGRGNAVITQPSWQDIQDRFGDAPVYAEKIVPRVHNSGHHTIEANVTSQFEQHIRAVSGLPLGSTDMLRPSVMINILGERNGEVTLRGLERVLALPEVHPHLYGKAPTKIERKMGHLTVIARTAEEAKILAEKARKELSI